jgi:hypothetical protein
VNKNCLQAFIAWCIFNHLFYLIAKYFHNYSLSFDSQNSTSDSKVSIEVKKNVLKLKGSSMTPKNSVYSDSEESNFSDF